MKKRVIGIWLCISMILNGCNAVWAEEGHSAESGSMEYGDYVSVSEETEVSSEETGSRETEDTSEETGSKETEVSSEETGSRETEAVSEETGNMEEIDASAAAASDSDSLNQIHEQEAWASLPKNGNGIKVGMIDTGFAICEDCTYAAILNREQSVRIVNGNTSPIEDDPSADHGTTVADIFTSACGDGYPLADMVDLVLVDIAADGGKGSVSDLCNAIRYLADCGTEIINISLGYSESGSNELLEETCRYASADRGITIVCADGYSGGMSGNIFPAKYDTTISVAADANIYNGFESSIDYVVPGTDNSYAAPVVTAAMAVLKYNNRENSSIWSADRVLQEQGNTVRILSTESISGNSVGVSVENLTADYQKEQAFTGEPVCPEISLQYNGIPLYKDKDYLVRYSNNIELGNAARIEIIGKTFIGRRVFDFSIQENKWISEYDVSLKELFYTYTGKPIEPKPEFCSDYGQTQYIYENNVEVGPASGTAITTYGNSVNIQHFKFFIIEDKEDIWENLVVSYSRKQKLSDWDSFRCSDLDVSYDGVSLSSDFDYSVEYFNTDHVGTDAKLIIKGVSFEGEKTYGFEIVPNDIGICDIGNIGSFQYTGDQIVPKINLTNVDRYWWWKLFIYANEHSEITYEYSDNVEAGLASGKAIISGLVEGELDFTFTISKEEEDVQGAVSENVQWKFDDDETLILYGEGPLSIDTDFENGEKWSAFLQSQGDSIKTVYIAEGITSIENNVLGKLDYVKKIYLPTSLNFIADRVFYNWRGLEEVVNYNPATVSSPLDTFYGTLFYSYYIDGDDDVADFPSEDEIIEFEFNDDPLSYRLFLNNGLLQIKDTSMTGDMSDKIIVQSHNWEEYAERIKKVSIINPMHKNVTIADRAFINLRNLETVRVSDAFLVSVGKRAFDGCDSLVEFSGSGCAFGQVDAYSFARCKELKYFYFTFGNKVSFLKDCTGAFLDCRKLESMKIIAPDGIPAFAFYGCTNLKEVRLASEVEYSISIGEYAFAKCENLESLLLSPYTINEVKAYGFAGCSLLDVGNFHPDVLGVNAYANTKGRNDGTIVYPLDKLLDEYHKNYSYTWAGDTVLIKKIEEMFENKDQSAESPEDSSVGDSTTGGNALGNGNTATGGNVIGNATTSGNTSGNRNVAASGNTTAGGNSIGNAVTSGNTTANGTATVSGNSTAGGNSLGNVMTNANTSGNRNVAASKNATENGNAAEGNHLETGDATAGDSEVVDRRSAPSKNKQGSVWYFITTFLALSIVAVVILVRKRKMYKMR